LISVKLSFISLNEYQVFVQQQSEFLATRIVKLHNDYNQWDKTWAKSLFAGDKGVGVMGGRLAKLPVELEQIILKLLHMVQLFSWYT